MSSVPSTSRERIIPIQIERDCDSPEVDESLVDIIPATPSKNEKLNESVQSTSSDDTHIERSLPLYDSPEKIIIVIDTSEDENFTTFKLNNNAHTPLYMLKRAIALFVKTKNLINKKHEYALVTLNESSAVWALDFTNNVNKIVSTLESIGSCEAEDIFELDGIFELILEHVKVPEACELEELIVPPSYVVRTVLFYNRSYTLPKLERTNPAESLLESPYFTLDVLMTHEPPGPDNNCEKISKMLQNLDRKGFAYFFSVARDAKSLFDSIGKLASHPLQRPIQTLANYKIQREDGD